MESLTNVMTESWDLCVVVSVTCLGVEEVPTFGVLSKKSVPRQPRRHRGDVASEQSQEHHVEKVGQHQHPHFAVNGVDSHHDYL